MTSWTLDDLMDAVAANAAHKKRKQSRLQGSSQKTENIAIMARVQVINETTLAADPGPDDWTLWLQWGRYIYDDGTMNYGYRFIWKRPKSQGGSLQAARGQARIPSMVELEQLTAKAKGEGWGGYDSEHVN